MFKLNAADIKIENLPVHLSFPFIYGNLIGTFQEILRIISIHSKCLTVWPGIDS